MVGYRRAHTSFTRSTVYLHTDCLQRDELCDAVRSAFEREIELFPSPFAQLAGSEQLSVSVAEDASSRYWLRAKSYHRSWRIL